MPSEDAGTARSSLVRHFREVATRRAGALAVEDDAERLDYAALFSRADRIGAALARRGLSAARVGLFSRAGAPWVAAFLGATGSGVTVVALSPLYPLLELTALFRDSRAEAVLASDDLVEAATRFAGDRPVLSIESLAAEPGAARPADTRDGSPALVLFTSGTTGRPKGAVLTHGNVLSLASVLAEGWGFSSSDVLLHTLPLHHLHGIGVSVMVALATGAATRFLSRFDPVRVWEELGRATVLMGVPTQHKKLFDAFDAADPETRARWADHARRLRLVTSGSAALPQTVGERWRSVTGRYPLERYGMTEIGIVLSNPLEGERRPGTVGKPLPGVELRIVRDGEQREHDEANADAGEIWVRGPTVFAGYDDEAVTRAAFTDGWFRTGDTASLSADGYVKILGRTSVDMLKSGGYRLSALEIEEALRLHGSISDVAVVGVPDPTWGDLVVAVVVLRASGAGEGAREAQPEPPSEESIRAWAKERLAAYKVPKRVVFVPDLPKNALGKVTKTILASEVRRYL